MHPFTNDYKRQQTDINRLITHVSPTFDLHEHINYLSVFHQNQKVMNTLRNKVQLIGRLGAKADYKVLDNGNALARISLATNEVYKNAKGERIEDTTWHQVVAWGKLAEIIHKYTDKGTDRKSVV